MSGHRLPHGWIASGLILLQLGGSSALAGPAANAAAVEGLLRNDPDDRRFAERLAEEIEPRDLARLLWTRRDLVPAVLERLGGALAAERRPALVGYLTACARALSRHVAAGGPPWTADDVDLLLTVQLVDPRRFVEEPAFRERVLSFLARSFAPESPAELRDRLLFELNHVRGFGFAASEEVEHAWEAVPRSSADRRSPYVFGEFRVPSPQGRIEASVYSLTSQYFDAEEAGQFLAAVERRAPERTLVVLADLPLRRELEKGRGEHTVLIETHGRPYTPWVRDPLLLTRRNGGGVAVLARPNLQPRREADGELGRELVQGLPPALDAAWGEVRWTTSPVPFHNGQVLLTEDALWLSLHTLELRILELLGLERVPVASFATSGGVGRYLGAARTAAAELAVLYGRRTRFVHPLPAAGTASERAAAMERLGGGAGFDLDSLLTLVPSAGPEARRPPTALVADLRSGGELLEGLPPRDWQRLRNGYRLTAELVELPAILTSYQATARGRRLGRFLDAVAEHLEAEGLPVRRLPHLLVPTALLPERDELDYPDFQITWNNVVIDTGAEGRPRAEGFSSLLERGDEEARRIYAEAGVGLELLPALVPSIVRNGGYRCASNHLRRN